MRYAFTILSFCALVLFGFEWSTVYGSDSETTGTAPAETVTSTGTQADDHSEHADHGDDSGHGHGEKFNPAKALNPLLSFQKDTTIYTAVVFLLIMFFLGKFAFFPVVEALNKREQSVADNIASAEKANNDAKELLAQYQQKLNDAQVEVRQILEDGKKEAEQAGLAIVEKAKQASAAERAQSAKEIETATVNALQELATKSATLATELAGKIIKSKITPESQKDLIDKAVENFTKQ